MDLLQPTMSNYHLFISGAAVIGFFLFNLMSLLIGFWLGKQIGRSQQKTLYPGEKIEKPKNTEPFVENVKETDPWNIAQEEDNEGKPVKIIGGL